MQGNNNSRIKEALKKKAEYGEDVDLSDYEIGRRDKDVIEDLKSCENIHKETMESVGVTADEGLRAATVMFIDNTMSHCSSKLPEGVEIMSTSKAVEKYDWLKDYAWSAVDPGKDKFTALAYLEKSDGYFIRIKSGYHIEEPIQSCMLIESAKTVQNVHNLIFIEDNASANLITGCATGTQADKSMHVGITETFMGDNSNLTFSMIHNWGSETVVRPRTAVNIGAKSNYTSNYVILDDVGTLQTNPVANVNGEGSSAKFNSMCIAQKNSSIDSGSVVNLNAKNTSSEIISRSIIVGGKMIARGRLVGNCSGVKAHLECKSIILSETGSSIAIPELEANVSDLEMTHEAAVGKIARNQIEYLMSRGLSEEEAISMIVSGFLSGGIDGLPKELEDKITEAINIADLGD